MSLDLARALNAPETITFAGREFPARQLTLSEWAGLQSWLKRSFPSPYLTALQSIDQAAELGITVSAATRDAALAHAAELARKWPPAVGSSAWLRALDSVEGGPARFVRTALGAAAGPGAGPTEAEAEALADAAGPADWSELLRATYYGEPPGPKGGATGAATPTPTPTPSTNGDPPFTP